MSEPNPFHSDDRVKDEKDASPSSGFEETENSSPSIASEELVIEDLLDRWEEARENGQDIDVDELCRSFPALADQVRSRIARLQAIDGRIGPGLGGGKDTDDRTQSQLPIHTKIEELEFLQRGGLGAVYVGEDVSAHRRVAVKFLHGHLAADPMCRERFLLEAEVTGRLEHPGVIPLYGIGESTDGEPFYAMRFIDGHSMDELITELYADAQSDPTSRIENDRRYRKLLNDFVTVCKTIAYAHNRGIVHRDLKPANVMLGRYGETIVVDWGLAVPVVRDEAFRQSGEATLMPAPVGESSSSGQGAGTPVYMSPEQASKLAPTPASDIYSLGATLYKILSGKNAVQGGSIAEIKEKVIDGRIDPLSAVRPSTPPPLAAIVRKAMSVKPADRYATALEMAEDVEAFLSDESVSAHQEPWHARFMRLARRNRSATQTAVIALLLGSVLAGFAFLSLGAYATRETFLRKDAEKAQENANEARAKADQLHLKSMSLSAQFLAKSIANEIDLRWRILEAEAGSTRLRELMTAVNAKTAIAPEDTNQDIDAIVLSSLQPEQLELQSWVYERFIKHQEAVKTDSWFAQGQAGYQFARAPIGSSLGRNYRHRDYFNGIGYDLTREELDAREEPIRPLASRIVHMSAVYESTITGTLKVTFSVPVYDDEPEKLDRKPIGVIGMSIELGDFEMDKSTWLVDTRPDQFNEQRGLLLQHPGLGQRSQDGEVPHLSRELVDKMMDLRGRRLRDQSGKTDGDATDGSVMTVPDPIDATQTRVVAVEPVIIRGRPAEIADTGWIVVVAE